MREREDRGISFLLSSVVFHVVPTALEISMVCGILVSFFTLSLRFCARRTNTAHAKVRGSELSRRVTNSDGISLLLL